MPNPKSTEEAQAWVRAGLATVYQNIAFGYSVPLFWYVPDGSRREPVRHLGTAFFVDLGIEPFAITAHHVIEGFRRDARISGVRCQLGRVVINPDDRLLDEDPAGDVATIKVSAEEISASGRNAYTHPGTWPPELPTPGCGVFFGGYRRLDLIETPTLTSFGFMGALFGMEGRRGVLLCGEKCLRSPNRRVIGGHVYQCTSQGCQGGRHRQVRCPGFYCETRKRSTAFPGGPLRVEFPRNGPSWGARS